MTFWMFLDKHFDEIGAAFVFVFMAGGFCYFMYKMTH